MNRSSQVHFLRHLILQSTRLDTGIKRPAQINSAKIF